jgi:DNA topoisomerase-1
MPGKWKKVIHDNTVTWLATWTENVNHNHKYVFLAAGSSLKGQSDMQKFEKARELKVRNLIIRSTIASHMGPFRTISIKFVATITMT